MSGRVFDGRIARGIAPDDRARQERLKATARALVTAVRDGLVRDGVVRLHGFGTFRLRPVAARKGRHPRTGEPIDIPAGWRVMFRPAKALRERVEPDPAPSFPIGEPHASREAMLAASAARETRRGAGAIPADGLAAAPSVESGRAAAAAMAGSKFSVQGPVPPGSAAPKADPRATRSPTALTGVPAAYEQPPRAETPATEPSAPVPRSDAGTGGRRHGYRYARVLLLVLLLAGLAWLFRPAGSPEPRMAEESVPGASGAPSGDAAGGSPEAAAVSDGAAPEEPAAASAGAEPSDGESGTGDDTTAARETADAPSTAAAERAAPASPDDTGAAGESGAGTGETTTAGTDPADGPTGTDGDVTTEAETADAPATAAADRAAPASPDDTRAAGERAARTGETATAGADRADGQTATEGEATAAAGTADAPATAVAESDASVSADATSAAGEDGADAGTGTPAGTEPSGGETGAGDGAARADASTETTAATAAEPEPPTSSAGAGTDSGDAVMAALARAADTAGATSTETAKAGGETGAAGDRREQPAVDAGAASDQGRVAEDAAAGTRVPDEAAADGQPYFSGRDYTVRRGDTLWDLAERHYVNPYYWPHIWNHNGGIANPNRLEVWQGLWLPALEGDPRALTQADRRSIAEGYLRLYRFFREQGDANPQYALVGVRHFDASVLPERLRGTAAGHPDDTLAAAFQARLEAGFPLD